MELMNVFGARLVSGLMPEPRSATTCDYVQQCDDYYCLGYDCLYVFECHENFTCNRYFYCENGPNYEDFTCVSAYITQNCSAPAESIPCPY